MTLVLLEKTVVTVTTITEKFGKDFEENDTPAEPAGPDMTDNRNSNGDVLLPYQYQKNGWNIEFDMDISERIQNGLFLLKITPHSTPNGAMPETKLVLQKPLGGKNNFNIYDKDKNTHLPISISTNLDLKQNFSNRNLEYSIGNWGDNSYIYLFVNGHNSGIFYIFPADAGGNYLRV